MPFKTVYDHNDFIIINKPINASFHNNDGELGVASLMSQAIGSQLWPVHRIDKITSGLLIFAKNKAAANQFNQLFLDKKMSKIYFAISNKKPKKKQGKVIGDMKKVRDGNWKLTTSRNNPAITLFDSCSLIPGKRFFWLKPQTGKTHQIRVALKSLGAPILGDQRYSSCQADRTYLHAHQLNFKWDNQLINVSCFPQQGELFFLPEIQDCINYFTQKN
ncbi:TIGR01621 family pseudouridine synthase [Aliikangiella sp. IMCC44359]|uniref:TIGR01621 family pseudouridine synthase n=1 Tax=Aliikangiella sp. IMCC44359 TaxID=3459125 RepID=UPI00403B1E4B